MIRLHHVFITHTSLFQQNDDNLVLTYNFKTTELVIQTKDKSGEWEVASHEEITEADMWKEWVCLRTKFTLKYQIDSSKSCREQLQRLLDESKRKLCETDKPVIRADGTDIVLKKDKVYVGIGKSTKVSAVVREARKEASGDGSRPDPTQFETIDFTISASDESVDDISAVFGSKWSGHIIEWRFPGNAGKTANIQTFETFFR